MYVCMLIYLRYLDFECVYAYVYCINQFHLVYFLSLIQGHLYIHCRPVSKSSAPDVDAYVYECKITTATPSGCSSLCSRSP